MCCMLPATCFRTREGSNCPSMMSVHKLIHSTHCIRTSVNNILLVYRYQPKRYRTALIFSRQSSTDSHAISLNSGKLNVSAKNSASHYRVGFTPIRGYHYNLFCTEAPFIRHGHILKKSHCFRKCSTLHSAIETAGNRPTQNYFLT